MTLFLSDLRYALRSLLRTPAFTATALLTLALGIGASTAIFTVVDSIVLKPLAYPDSDRLVVAWEHVKFLSGDPVGPNPRHVDLWRQRATAFSGLTLLHHSATGLTLDTEHPVLVGTVASLPNLFEVLQVAPFLGRGFLPQDGVGGHDHVAILSYRLWQTLFEGDPAVLSRTIRIADIPHEVIGVLPAAFHFPNANALRAFHSSQPSRDVLEPDLFLPAVLDLGQFSWNGEYGNWIALGRLKSGFTIGQAESQLASIESQIISERQYPPVALSTSIQPLHEAVVGESATALWLLMAAVAGLMLIGCLNLANAQLGRAFSREREAAIRIALGAARWRVVWNALAEGLLLSIVGGVAGILLANAAVTSFRRYSPVDLPRLAEVRLNSIVLLFSLAAVFTSIILSGLVPALRLLATDPQASLQQTSSRTAGNRHSHRFQSWLIGLQVFGCMALLLVTALFSKSLLYLLHQDKGFETGHTVSAEVRLSPKTYGSIQNRTVFNEAVLQNLRAIPGVQAAGLGSAMLLAGESFIEELRRVDSPNQITLINLRWVSPGYFEAVRQKLVAGRFFEERDRNLNSAVLSDGVAKALWGSRDPIGTQVTTEDRTFTVIGVVADSRSTSLKSQPARMTYLHYADRPPYTSYFFVRGMQSSNSLVSSVRQAVWSYAPNVTIARVKTLDAQLTDSLSMERFHTFVFVAFGTAALLLAMLGIYGVLTYAVVMRTQEIGLRMAIGATRRRIYALTLREAGAPIAFGLVAGLIASLLAERTIRTLLYGIQGVDLLVILMVTGVLLASATTAAVLPARRAASIDPMAALRCE